MAGDDAAPSGEPSETDDPVVVDDVVVDDDADEPSSEVDSETEVATTHAKPKRQVTHVQLALIVGLVAAVALGALTGWLGYRTYESRMAEEQRQEFLQVGRQGALNLTTLGFEQIDADVQRILDSATGTFYDDFQQRAPAFADVVKQVKSTSTGTITEAGIETGSLTATQAQVLVAVTVKSVIVGQPDQEPRLWRMRISVQKVGEDTKVSKVDFVL